MRAHFPFTMLMLTQGTRFLNFIVEGRRGRELSLHMLENVVFEIRSWKKEKIVTVLLSIMQVLPEEEINEKEWWSNLEKVKEGPDGHEIVIKANYGKNGAEILKNFCRQLELHL